MPLPRPFILLWSMLIITASMLHAGGGFKYSYMPKKIYENQIFPVTVIDTREEKSKPVYQFETTESTLKPLSTIPLVIRNGNDNFYTFYYKAKGREITIPRLVIHDNGKITILESHTIPVEKLIPKKDFCGVLAADMKIRNSQVSHYDEKNYLVTLSIEAYEANLEDMHLNNVLESGIEDVVRKGAKVKGEFYIVIPETQKKVTFSYFNTIKHQYISLNTSVELLDSSVTTQTDLTPKEDSFDKFKKYMVMALVGFFLLMFLIYRDFFYLVLGTVALITLLTFYTPKEKVCIKQGASFYILPTETSSISTKIDHQYTTFLLGKRKIFNKVAYRNNMIGWVKDEDLCKN